MKKTIRILALLLCAVLLSGCCLKHEWEPATCEDPITCEKCGETYGDELDHQPGLWEQLSVPLWGQPGLSVQKCLLCGEVLQEKSEAAVDLYDGDTFTLDVYETKDRLEAVLKTFSADYSCRFNGREGLNIHVFKGETRVAQISVFSVDREALYWDDEQIYQLYTLALRGLDIDQEPIEESVFDEVALSVIGCVDPALSREGAEEVLAGIIGLFESGEDYANGSFDGENVDFSATTLDDICSFSFHPAN